MDIDNIDSILKDFISSDEISKSIKPVQPKKEIDNTLLLDNNLLDNIIDSVDKTRNLSTTNANLPNKIPKTLSKITNLKSKSTKTSKTINLSPKGENNISITDNDIIATIIGLENNKSSTKKNIPSSKNLSIPIIKTKNTNIPSLKIKNRKSNNSIDFILNQEINDIMESIDSLKIQTITNKIESDTEKRADEIELKISKLINQKMKQIDDKITQIPKKDSELIDRLNIFEQKINLLLKGMHEPKEEFKDKNKLIKENELKNKLIKEKEKNKLIKEKEKNKLIKEKEKNKLIKEKEQKLKKQQEDKLLQERNKKINLEKKHLEEERKLLQEKKQLEEEKKQFELQKIKEEQLKKDLIQRKNLQKQSETEAHLKKLNIPLEIKNIENKMLELISSINLMENNFSESEVNILNVMANNLKKDI